MENSIVHWVSPNELEQCEVVAGLYSKPDNYESIKENIKNVGILTPLHIIGKKVVSGNLRLRIAKELEIPFVPVIYIPKSTLKAEVMTVSYSQQREKKCSEILAEFEILEREYPFQKGSRTDIDLEKKKIALLRKQTIHSKTKLFKLKAVKSIGTDLFGYKSERYNQMWADLDSGKVALDRMYKSLKNEQRRVQNKLVLPLEFNINSEDIKVYNKSCSSLDEVSNESINCIVCSPPYFKMRDNGMGKYQRGKEKNYKKYLEGLIHDFSNCSRVLKQNGSLWVNLSEPAEDGVYNLLPHRFAIEMIKEGWILNDEIIWIRNNPAFTEAKRSVRAHEYLFQFVKSKDFHYDTSWLNFLSDPNDLISYGTSAKVSNLLSAMDFRDNILRTNANRIENLRKDCKAMGFHLTHNASFPITIPLIAILTSTTVGDTVLDIFSGTGTTGEAAISCGRKYIGYETSPEYALTSAVRMKDYIGETVIKESLLKKAS